MLPLRQLSINFFANRILISINAVLSRLHSFIETLMDVGQQIPESIWLGFRNKVVILMQQFRFEVH